MSNPIGGYDDWQGDSLWRDSGWTDVTYNLNGGFQFDVNYDRGSSFACMYVEISVTGTSIGIEVRHKRFSSDTGYYVSAGWVLHPDQVIRCNLPMLSNLLTFNFVNTTGVAASITIRTQQNNFGTDKPHYYAPLTNFGVTTVLLGAGLANTYTPPYLMPGPATIFLDGPAAGSTLDARLDTYDRNNVLWNTIYHWWNFGQNQVYEIQIPITYYRIRIGNGGGAGQTFSFNIANQAGN